MEGELLYSRGLRRSAGCKGCPCNKAVRRRVDERTKAEGCASAVSICELGYDGRELGDDEGAGGGEDGSNKELLMTPSNGNGR